ncbi:hypothetical protein UFOVP785_88 [uncultured Caudovirales phage]|uniref:Uncharacterized protein n=1 Tax=uncultured Caudovirales phage TaxID=2100421 RepID=A0A6J5NUN4_9CAUD|nr:hypothetical protein UFOVP785_88 [uncultured Caudovirales phage]
MPHTPGPWKVSTTFIEGGQFPGIYRENAVAQWGKPAIAHAIDDDPNWEANARLIAAAPDLLDILQQIANTLNEGIICRFEPGCRIHSKINEVIKAIG